jgi:mannose-6-phosphate isomerase-like protein (cupin superfamily)
VEGRAGVEPSFVGVVLDGILIAALIVISNAASPVHGGWCLEMSYDQAHAALGPGQLLLLLATGEALARGDRFLNFLQNFAYFKHRWGTSEIEVVNDEEHNFLLQIGGTKKMSIADGAWSDVLDRGSLRSFFVGNGELARYSEHLEKHSEHVDLAPGDGVHIPSLHPHWVQNGPNVSISFGIPLVQRHDRTEASPLSSERVAHPRGLQPERTGRAPPIGRAEVAARDREAQAAPQYPALRFHHNSIPVRSGDLRD